MKKIELSKQGKNKGKYFTLVDNEDYEFLNQFNWSYDGKYACRRLILKNNWKKITLQRFLIGKKKKNKQIDHINRDKLDNRKSNLRFCSGSQNSMNRPIRSDNKSGYKGVIWHKKDKKFQAYITLKRKTKHLGEFDNIIDAVKCYNKHALKLHGEFSSINVI